MESLEDDVPLTLGQSHGQVQHWKSFKLFVQYNEAMINVFDEITSQILFWAPYSTEGKSRWREIAYGLLSLQRMAIDMAKQHTIKESHGTSIEILPKLVPITSLRIGITIIQSLLPTILQISKPKNRKGVRLSLERIKFMLRMCLIGSYWYHLYRERKIDACGLVESGGIYDPSNEAEGTTVEQVQSWRKRQLYVGKRSGRRVVSAKHYSVAAFSLPENDFVWPLMISELWHIYRPLHWAGIEYTRNPGLEDWASMLGLDIVTLLLLQNNINNKFSSKEMRRRKLKLFLYLLRSPIFDKYSKPTASRVFQLVGKLPLFGPVLENYLWDWVHYWKHPFVAEED